MARHPDAAELVKHADGELFEFDGATYARDGGEASRLWGLEFFDGETEGATGDP